MQLDPAELESFRTRFEAKEPDPKNFFRRVTKFDFYLSVEDLVEDRRSKGFAWAGIAEDFTALGVAMPISTLKTCFRRARARRPGTVARPKRPSRTPHVRRVRSAAPAAVEPEEASAEASNTSPESPPPTECVEERPDPASKPTAPAPLASTPRARDLLNTGATEGSREEVSRSPAIDQASGHNGGVVEAAAVMAFDARPEVGPAPRPEVSGLDAIRARASPRETRRLAFVPKPDGDL